MYLICTENDTNCTSPSLQETSECLRQKVVSIFNYTIREDYPKTYEDLLANGGDCYDYSLFYISMFENAGYNATRISLPHHSFAIAYKEEEDYTKTYCVLDQTALVGCMNLG